jgi:hypothetical protein
MRSRQEPESALWIEVTARSPRITGVVHRSANPDVAFSGWIELMSVLDVEQPEPPTPVRTRAASKRPMSGDSQISLVNLLEQTPLLRAYSRKQLQLLDRAAIQAAYDPGDLLCSEGAVGRQLILLIEGEALVERGTTEVATVGPGDLIGELSLLDHRPRTATVTAITAIKALVIPARDFWQVMDDAPAVSRQAMATLAQRLRSGEQAL